VPKYILGKPADVFATTGPPLPAAVQQRVFTRLLDTLVGDVTRFGLPAPVHAGLQTHPIMNTAVLDHLGHGDLVARPDVAALAGDAVRFVDGTVEPYDVVVWATGFQPSFPVVPDGTFAWRGWNPDLFLNVFHRDRDDLFVMGMIETDAMMGGEESGGFGFGMHLPERDGIYADLLLLDLHPFGHHLHL
jgi:hypothetical protein